MATFQPADDFPTDCWLEGSGDTQGGADHPQAPRAAGAPDPHTDTWPGGEQNAERRASHEAAWDRLPSLGSAACPRCWPSRCPSMNCAGHVCPVSLQATGESLGISMDC